MNDEKGQSLVELLIGMGIFVLAVSTITWLIVDVYLADRVARERMIATFLAKEGMEATRSIRDNNWDDLTNGYHGLAISGNNWIFQGTENDISGKLKQGIRRINIESISPDKKKIISQVTWELTGVRLQDVSLITYLTNWARISCQDFCQPIGYDYGTCRANAIQCFLNDETYESGGDEYCLDGPSQDTCCCGP